MALLHARQQLRLDEARHNVHREPADPRQQEDRREHLIHAWGGAGSQPLEGLASGGRTDERAHRPQVAHAPEVRVGEHLRE